MAGQELPRRRAIQDDWLNFYFCLEGALDVMTSLFDLYTQINGKRQKVAVENLEKEVFTLFEAEG